ncbi:MAG: PAS domain S-box protein [Gammaproteobacteria bacterium]|nr:PAS domain S-box protein [Gammaproteobacteria bacterium]
MIQRQPFNQLFLIMATAALLVSAISIFSLYHTAIEQHRLRLVETVKSQARLIEAIAEFDDLDSEDKNPERTRKTVLEKVAAAHNEFEGFGDSGEFALARRDGDQIVFVLSQRHPQGHHPQSQTPRPIPFSGLWAEPMRRALAGKSGVLTGLDYRGIEVLAAHEPVSILDLGLVAKIDVSEIREPFIHTGMLTIGATILVIFIASGLFFRVSRPIEHIIDQQAETFRTLAVTAHEGIVIANTDGIIEFVNPAVERLFGYKPGELLGRSVKCLMPDEHSMAHDGYIQRYLQTGLPRIIGTSRQLTALRKDGSRFPVYLSIGDIKTSHARLFAGVILDMSEQRQLQREILEIPVSEQRRIGQELHDGLGQQLTGLGLLATSLLNKASKPEHDLAARLANGLQEAISQVRALSRGLMPVDINAEGFANALENLAGEIRSHSNIPVLLTLNRRIHVLDNTSAMHLYRIAQEALNNAVKHAHASQIQISLGLEGKRGCLSIRDNGRGFDGSPQKSLGLGLRIMQHRCALIDAEFEIKSSHVEGTEVKCYFMIET